MKPRVSGPWPWCAVWLACLAAAPAGADPMRPLTPPAGAASAADGAPPAVADATPTAETRVRRLLAIREDNTGRRAALFGDRWVRAGDRYTAPEGETVVLAVGAHHVDVEQNKLRSTHHLLAPLLPPQWPALPAAHTPYARAATARLAGPAGPAGAAAGNPNTRPPAPRPPAPAAAGAATALRTERPSSP